MAGSFPGVSNCQQQDNDGRALAGALLTVYVGGTTTPAAVFQDIGLLIPQQNPMVADLSGRLPLFFVADGTYHLRLTDSAGNVTNGGFDLPQVPSIGPSGGGGGGTPVDATTVFSTGDYKFRPSDETLAGWVRMNGRTIGSAVSGASERANNDTSALFQYIWNNYSDALCPVVGGRGATAAADFAANKQITVLDLRACGIVGLDTMGNAAKGGFASVPFVTGTASTGGATAGTMLHTMAQAELPNVTLNTTIAAGQGSHTHDVKVDWSGGNATQAGADPIKVQASGTHTFTSASGNGALASTLPQMTGTTPTGGAGTAFSTMTPAVLGTHFWKL